ncbi:MAG TPA: hypothetical protein PK080_05545, partial [Hyphomonadaceae bacterium]|nr:hypothetical protein [Hyphomonadaceae bacterium]
MSGVSPLEHLKRLIIDRTGHYYYIDKEKLLYERARERMRARGIASLEQYVGELERAGSGEWRALE